MEYINLKQNTEVFLQEYAYENVVYAKVSIC